MIVIPASLRSDFIHMAGMTIHIALESTIHIVGIRTSLRRFYRPRNLSPPIRLIFLTRVLYIARLEMRFSWTKSNCAATSSAWHPSGARYPTVGGPERLRGRLGNWSHSLLQPVRQ
jgi:hypothetical protein